MIGSRRRVFVVVTLFLVLVMTALFVLPLTTSPALARPLLDEPADEQEEPGQPIEPAVFPDDPVPDQEDGDRAGVGAAVYILNPTMNYQGFLTDSGGSPVNDTLDFTVSLWDQPGVGAGNRMWGEEVHNNVTVADGLFSLALGSNVALNVPDFRSHLVLEIEVGGTTLPRQLLRGVPYAMTLAPGAQIGGSTHTRPMIDVLQYGKNFAIWAQEESPAWHYGLGADRIYSSEGYASGGDSFLWVPGNLAFSENTGVTLDPQFSGILRVDCTAVGNKSFGFFVTIPGQLYGHDVVIEEVRVYYYVTHARSPVYLSQVWKLNEDGTPEMIADEPDDQDSTTYTSFEVAMDPPSGHTLNENAGPLAVWLAWECETQFDGLYLGAVRLRLGHPRSDL